LFLVLFIELHLAHLSGGKCSRKVQNGPFCIIYYKVYTAITLKADKKVGIIYACTWISSNIVLFFKALAYYQN